MHLHVLVGSHPISFQGSGNVVAVRKGDGSATNPGALSLFPKLDVVYSEVVYYSTSCTLQQGVKVIHDQVMKRGVRCAAAPKAFFCLSNLPPKPSVIYS